MSDAIDNQDIVQDNLSEKVAVATRWSLITQLASKLISPITTLVLAHLLSPEVFGVVALVTMVTSFADMFSDAGFQKYLIQHEFESQSQYSLSCSVAFWTNMFISVFIWIGIGLARHSLAVLLGDSTIGLALVVACTSLPLTAAVSVQTAFYQRKFDFKTLFYSRMGSALLIFVVAVPMAIAGFGYWSMIASTIASNLFLAVWLTAKSEWKPQLIYGFAELKEMFSFSAWTLVEAFSIWLISWAGPFILGTLMNTYYLGLFNTSVAFANAVVGVVSASINPIIFSALSRLQDDEVRFKETFFLMQKYLAFAVIPLAVALAVFSDAAVGLYLGESWLEASLFFGLYSLASSLVVVFCHVASAAYRAKGKPRYSLYAQLAFLLVMVPSYIIGARLGWALFSIIVPTTRVVGFVSIHFVICKMAMGLSPLRMISNLKWIYIASVLAALPAVAIIHLLSLNYLQQCLVFLIAAAIYIVLCIIVKDLRSTLVKLLRLLGLNRFANKFD